jgi:septum formation protein
VEKASEVARRLGNPAWIIAADTVVILDGKLYEKPEDRRDARRMLRALGGRTHTVVSGVCLMDSGTGRKWVKRVLTKVTMKKLNSREIEAYLDTGEPFDKAGSYAAQGIGAFIIRRVNGSYTNVVGLPLCELAEMMAQAGAAKVPVA